MKSSDFKKQALSILANNWGKGVAITAAYLLILLAVQLLLKLTDVSPLLNLIIAMGNLVISVPISYGLFSAFIKLKRIEDVKAFDFLKDGFANFGKAWKITGHVILKLLVPIIIMVVLYFILSYLLSLIFFSLFFGKLALSNLPILLFIVIVALLAVSIWLNIKSLFYVFAFPIAYDNQDMTAKDVVLKSKELMKGNRWKYFVLNLTFIGWILLAGLTLGIGTLWLVPYMQVAELCFYEYLCSKKEENNA